MVWHRIADFQAVSLIQIAEDILLGSPAYAEHVSLPLVIPGTLADQRLVLPERVRLYASPNNPGALRAATALASEYEGQGIKVITRANDDGSWDRTHFFLYLNRDTFVGEDMSMGAALAAEVRCARQQADLPIVMAHENDVELRGCEFGHFFGTTPNDLITDGLYTALAVAFVSGAAERRVSYALCAKLLGATTVRRGLQQVLVQSEGSVSNALRGRVARRLRQSGRSVINVLKGLGVRRVRRVPRGTAARGREDERRETVLVEARRAATEEAEPSAGPDTSTAVLGACRAPPV